MLKSQVQDSFRVAEVAGNPLLCYQKPPFVTRGGGYKREDPKGTHSFLSLAAWWMVVPFADMRKAGPGN